MNAKQCFKCGEVKDLSCFYRHPGMKDGRVNKCKECNKRDVRQNRKHKVDYYREYDKKRAMEPHRVDARRAYQQSERGKAIINKIKERWEKKNPIKKAAQTMVGNAVRDGKLHKPSVCELCGTHSNRLHGHHDDYAKPLEVRWLCAWCHNKWHRENGEVKNSG